MELMKTKEVCWKDKRWAHTFKKKRLKRQGSGGSWCCVSGCSECWYNDLPMMFNKSVKRCNHQSRFFFSFFLIRLGFFLKIFILTTGNHNSIGDDSFYFYFIYFIFFELNKYKFLIYLFFSLKLLNLPLRSSCP